MVESKPEEKRVNRRKFIAAGAGVVVVAAAAGAAYYLVQPAPTTIAPTTATTTQTVTAVTTATPTPTVQVMTDATITLAINSILRGLDPITAISNEELTDIRSVYQGLSTTSFTENKNLSAVPQLAERWESSADSKVWTFHLRKDAYFSTGNKLTAKDIVFSYARGIEANNPSYPPIGTLLDPKTSFRIIDDNTVEMTLKSPYAGFPDWLCSTSMAIVDSDTVKSHMTKDDPTGSTWLNDNSAGSGPFKLESWERGRLASWVRDENYWGKNANYDVAKFKTWIDLTIPEPTAEALMIEKGQIDIGYEMTNDMAAKYIKEKTPGILVYPALTNVITMLYINTASKPEFQDANVMRAIRHAINYELIVKEIMLGFGSTSTSIWAQGSHTITSPDPTNPRYSYDPDKAKEFMSESKYSKGFKATITYGTGAGMGVPWEDIVLQETSDLAKIGIELTGQQFDWSVMDEKLFKGNFEIEQGWVSGYTDADANASFYMRSTSSSGFPSFIPGWWKKNPDSAAEIDKSLDEARVETDRDKRTALYWKADEIFMDSGPLVVVAQAIKPYIMRSWIKGYEEAIIPDSSMTDWYKLYRVSE